MVFFFIYLYFVMGWCVVGVELVLFLLFVDEVFVVDVDLVWLSGGYFEFYVGKFVVVIIY